MDFDAGQCSIVRQKRGVPRAEAAAPAIHVRGEDFCEAAGGGWGAGRGGGGGGWVQVEDCRTHRLSLTGVKQQYQHSMRR